MFGVLGDALASPVAGGKVMGLGLGGAFFASTRVAGLKGRENSAMTGEMSGGRIRGAAASSLVSSPKSKLRARFSLELEMDFCNDENDGDGRLGGWEEMGDEVKWWRNGLGTGDSSAGGVCGACRSARMGESGAGMADR